MLLAASLVATAFMVSPQVRPAGAPSRSAAPAMGSTADFKNGLTIEFENSVWKVTDFLHVKPGKGSAFVRSTLKNLETGKTLERTWRSGESFPDAQVDKTDMTFSYVDGDEVRGGGGCARSHTRARRSPAACALVRPPARPPARQPPSRPPRSTCS